MPRKRSKRTVDRRGLALMEVLVASMILLTVMTVSVPVVIYTSRVWKQTRHVQLAHDELAGQLDRLVAMSADDRSQALETLAVNEDVAAVLVDASLEAELIDDGDGKRIELSINWQRLGDPPPLSLTAWIRPTPPADPAKAADAEKAEESSPDEPEKEAADDAKAEDAAEASDSSDESSDSGEASEDTGGDQ